MFKVKNTTLLLIACIVWAIAGFNVLRIGILAYPGNMTVFNLIFTVIIFAIFQFGIFGRMVVKHTRRILGYEEPQLFIKFFDLKSFIIMAFMISLGVYIRVSGFTPDHCIAVFYTGLGSSLFLAGILFGANFLKSRAA